MKFSAFATLALVQQADAHFWPFGHHHGHHGHHHHHEEIKPLEDFQCKYDSTGDMEHFEFLNAVGKTIWTHLVKGIYNDKISTPVSDKCFGQQNLEKFDEMQKLHHKFLSGDFFNMSMAEHQKVATDVIEMAWTNADECGALVPVTDIIQWCGDNDGVCVHKHGLLERLMDNSFPMMMMAYEMWGIIRRDTLCENQTEKLVQVGKFVENAGNIWSLQEGFDMKFDAKKELPHESIKDQIHATIKKVHSNWPEKKRCPFRPIIDLVKGIEDEVKEEIGWQVKRVEHHVKHTVDSFNYGFDYLHHKWGEPKSMIPHVPDFTPRMPQMNFFMPHHQSMTSVWGQFPPHMEMPNMQMPRMEMPHMNMQMPRLW